MSKQHFVWHNLRAHILKIGSQKTHARGPQKLAPPLQIAKTRAPGLTNAQSVLVGFGTGWEIASGNLVLARRDFSVDLATL